MDQKVKSNTTFGVYFPLVMIGSSCMKGNYALTDHVGCFNLSAKLYSSLGFIFKWHEHELYLKYFIISIYQKELYSIKKQVSL